MFRPAFGRHTGTTLPSESGTRGQSGLLPLDEQLCVKDGERSTCEVQGLSQPHQGDVVCVSVAVVAFMDQDVAHEACRSEQRVQRVHCGSVDGPGCRSGLPVGQKHRAGSRKPEMHPGSGQAAGPRAHLDTQCAAVTSQ